MEFLRALAPLLLVGCSFAPDLGDGQLQCAPGGGCPPGYACAADDRCHRVTAGDGAADGAADGASAPSADLACKPSIMICMPAHDKHPCGLIADGCGGLVDCGMCN
ncbi:MAG TPA: hypothetical protein VFF06_20145 [Polyangia bacterium]|nr:hypothetical protein [Polyangia bacterium]